jgi:hypothetical protein
LSSEQIFDDDGDLVSSIHGSIYYNGMVTQENVSNADGERTDTLAIDPATGLVTQDTEWDPDSGAELDIKYYDDSSTDGDALTAENVLNANGQRTDYLVIDPTTGDVTQDRQFDPTTEAQTETIVYQDNQEVGRPASLRRLCRPWQRMPRLARRTQRRNGKHILCMSRPCSRRRASAIDLVSA